MSGSVRCLWVVLAVLTSGVVWAAKPMPAEIVPAAAIPPAAEAQELILEDQFGREQKLSALQGRVVVLVYGDRQGTDVCREFGEQLHILFHPSAKGKSPAEARRAPVAPLPGLRTDQASPDVLVVPVASTGKVPPIVQEYIRNSIKKASPEVVVLLDFHGVMQERFGLRSGEPNLVVFDARGRLRYRVLGMPDASVGQKIVQMIQDLRAEAVPSGP